MFFAGKTEHCLLYRPNYISAIDVKKTANWLTIIFYGQDYLYENSSVHDEVTADPSVANKQ